MSSKDEFSAVDLMPMMYLDNCVISNLETGKIETLHRYLLDGGLTGVYSAISIQDMIGSTGFERRLRLMDDLGLWRIDCSSENPDKLALCDERATQYYSRMQLLLSASNSMNYFQAALLRGSFESENSPQENQLENLLFKAIDDQLAAVAPKSKSFHKISEDRLEMQGQLKSMENDTACQREAFFGGRSLNDIRPPQIIEQIVKRAPEKDRENFASIFENSPQNFSGFYDLAHALTLVGYQSDKRLQKNNSEKKQKGSLSEIKDFQHIAYGLCCPAMCSSDKGVVRKAFAISEFLGLKRMVVYFDPASDQLSEISQANWK